MIAAMPRPQTATITHAGTILGPCPKPDVLKALADARAMGIVSLWCRGLWLWDAKAWAWKAVPT